MNKNLRRETIKNDLGDNAGRKISSVLLQGAIIVLLAVTAFLYVVFSGVGAGQPAVLDSMFSEDYAGEYEVADFAEAGTETVGSAATVADVKANGSSDYLNQSTAWSYTYNANATNPRRRYYWEGNSSSNKYYSGNGWFEVKGEGTVRQKTIIFTVHVSLNLQGVLATLASHQKLEVTGTATMKSTNGSDKDIKWGLKSGSGDPVNDPRSHYDKPDWGVQSDNFFTKDNNAEKTSTLSAFIPTSNILTICLMTRTQYSGWVGGRLPGAQLHSITLKFKSLDTTAPDVKLNTTYNSWAQSRDVAVKATDGESGDAMKAYSGKVGSTTLTCSPNGNVYTFKNVTGALVTSFTNKSNRTTSKTFSLKDMKIDRAKPTIGTPTLIVGGSTTAGAANLSTVYKELYVKFDASDADSGVKSVSVQNTITNATLAPVTTSGNTRVFGPIRVNGPYRITVTDVVNWTQTYDFQCFNVDYVEPTITVALEKVTSETDFSNAAVKAVFTVTDKADTTWYSAYNNYYDYQYKHGLKDFSVTHADGNRSNPQHKNVPVGAPTESYSNGVWTRVYTVYLAETASKYTFMASDKAGNSVSKTVSGETFVSAYVDTTAPRVTAYTVRDALGNNAVSQWTATNVTITLTVTDDYTSADGYNYYNKGSGVARVELRRDYAGGTVLQTYAPAGGIADGGTAVFTVTANYDEIQKYYWIVYDKAGNSSEMSTATEYFNNVNYTDEATKYANYYYNKKGASSSVVLKDSNPVVLTLFGSDGTTVFSSGMAEELKNKAGSAWSVSDTTVLQWTKDAQTVFKMALQFGPSGAKMDTANRPNVLVAKSTSLAGVVDNPGWETVPDLDSTAFVNAVANTANNKAANRQNASYEATGEGVYYYRFRFTNGAGVSYDSGVITVQRDVTGPDVKLIGFGDFGGGTIRTDEDIINNTTDFVSENELFRAADGWLGGKSLNAIIRIKDSGSGADGADQEYNISEGVTAIQHSLAKATIKFSHNGYSYVETTDFYQNFNGIWVLTVRLWNISDIKSRIPAMVKADGNLDIREGQGDPFVYEISVADFSGNVSNVTNSGGSSKLDYKVDPFTLRFEIASITETNDAGAVTNYKATPADGEWTRNKIEITVNKTQMGLSPVYLSYYLVDTIIDNGNGTVSGTKSWISHTDDKWEQKLVQSNMGSQKTATIIFDKNVSRFFQIALRVSNDTTAYNGVGETVYGGPRYTVPGGGEYDYIIIRQDADAPNMDSDDGKEMGFFFSTNGNIDGDPYVNGVLRDDIILYYATYEGTDGYVCYRKTNNADRNNVFVHKEVYLYIIASDATKVASSGLGSGIKTVKYTVGTISGDAYPVYNFGDSRKMYRSLDTDMMGYKTVDETFEVKVNLTDNQANSREIKYASDTDGHKLLPIIDSVIPTLSIGSAKTDSDGASYLNDNNMLSGNRVKSDVTVIFKVEYGMSDVHLYIRARDLGETIEDADGGTTLKDNSSKNPDTYKFLADGGIDLTEWTAISGKTFTAPGSGWNVAKEADWSYSFLGTVTIKNRYDVIAVTGTGLYCYLEAGDVFIDKIPPVLEKTVYVLESSIEEGTGTEVNPIIIGEGSPVKTIDPATATNDSVYAMYYVTDAGSGVDDASIKTVMPVAGNALTKVYMDDGDGVKAYFALLMTEKTDYKITFADVAGNAAESGVVQPAIDKNPVTLNVGMVTAEGGNYNYFDENGAYTSSEYVKVTLTVNYGSSGEGAVQWSVSEDGIEWTEYRDLENLNAVEPGINITREYNAARTSTTINFNLKKEQNKFYRFRAYNGVKVYRVENGEEVIPCDYRGLENDSIRVAIDRTAPVADLNASVISLDGAVDTEAMFTVIDAGAKVYGINKWYAKGVALGFKVDDPNSYGSGVDIDELRVDYSLQGLAYDSDKFVLSDDGNYYAYSGENVFLYEHYVYYTVTLFDRAGNSSQIVIVPNIDVVLPVFKDGAALTTEAGVYVPSDSDTENWTPYDVTAKFDVEFGISGAKLQYATAAGNGVYGAWKDVDGVLYNYGDFGVATDDGKSVSLADNYLFAPTGYSFDYTCKFRLVSGAGHIGPELTLGRIKIDNEVPEISAAVTVLKRPLSDFGLEDTTNTDPYTTVMSGWTQENVTVTVKTDSALASGFRIEYSVTQGSEKWIALSGTVGDEVSVYQLNGKTFIHRINSSKNDEDYMYRFVSGSGLVSEVYRVNGIKVDKVDPKFAITAEVSNTEEVTPSEDVNKFGTTTADNFLSNKLLDTYEGEVTPEEIEYIKNELAYSYGTYTSKNSVIVKVSITSVNFSGVSVYINGYLYEQFDYAGNETVSAQNPIDRYYVVTNAFRDSSVGYYDSDINMFDLDIKVTSGSGRNNNKSAKIAIDNDIPMIYVAGINGDKSTNWDETDYSDCWYVSSDTSINLKIGTLVYDGTQYVFSDRVNDSGYTVYYSINGGEWIDNNTTGQIKLIGKPYIENAVYRFKIASKSGMEYILGETAYDNMGNAAADGARIADIVNSERGMISHLIDEQFAYRMNVDSTEYTVSMSQLLPFAANGKDIVEESLDYSFADYTIVKQVNVYAADGSFTTQEVVMSASDYIYRRGDRITVKYDASVDNGYYHRYSEYGETVEGAFVPETLKTYGDGISDDEQTGSFTYKFEGYNLGVKSYFIKELAVTYSDVVIYRQSQNAAAVKATTSYSYKSKDATGNTLTLTVSIPVAVTYSDMEGNAVSAEGLEPGGYLVNAGVVTEGGAEINALSFRLANPKTVLLVKYFDETTIEGAEVENSEENPYSITDERDFGYVSSTYYKDFFQNADGTFTLGTEYSYDNCAFKVMNDIELSDAFGAIEVFGGKLDGGNFTVTMNGKDGLFGTLGGKVKNMVVNSAARTVTEGASVGAVASVIDGGSVENVRISAEYVIDGANGVKLGGLAGTIRGASVVTDVFADVKITNGGKALTSGNVGGLVGYFESGTLANTYTYSHIVLYNVSDEVKAGAVIGDALDPEFTGSSDLQNNIYVENNAFVNDEVKKGFIGTESGAENRAETIRSASYEEFVGTTYDVVGSKYIVGKSVSSYIIEKVYKTFNLELSASGKAENGIGTKSSPLEIVTVEQLRAIDEFVNLSYKLYEDIDMECFGTAIGLHQVFGGSFDGQGHKIVNFNEIDVADGNVVGLFAAIGGEVRGLVINVEMEIAGDYGTLNAGVIAGRILGGTVSNIIMIGNIDVESSGAIHIGAISGVSLGGSVYDIFSIVNIKVNSARAVAGGIIGDAADTVIGGTEVDSVSGKEYTKTVYALGRVEVYSESFEIGAISATRNLAEGSSNVYAVKDNGYSNGDVNNGASDKVSLVTFDDSDMRKSTFSDGTNVFNKVFVTDKLYYLDGLGTETDKFTVSTAEEFRKIEHMLYANYNVKTDITFDDTNEATAFKTIGHGLKFTGSIDGKNENSWSAEEGTLSSLMNVTDALVYENAGRITDLSVNVFYDRIVKDEELAFGAIAVINSTGTLRNVTVSGEINITGADKYGTTVIVSGFVGEGYGGTFESDSKVQNSISGLNITVSNVGTVYAGGYVGRVDGPMTLSYGIGNGTLDITGCGTVYAGTIVGAAYKNNEWSSLEETAEYRYVVTVDGEVITDLFGYKAE